MTKLTIKLRPITFLMAVAGISLVGCGGYSQLKLDVDSSVDAAQARVAQERQNSPAENPVVTSYITESRTPFLGKRSIPRKIDEELPSQYGRVTINQPGNFNLQQVAQILTEATGIPVTLATDVTQQPASNQQMNAGMQLAGNNSSIAVIQGQAMLQQQFPITLPYRDMPLGAILDGISASAGGLSWQYKNGKISFFRYVTKTWTVDIPVGDVKTEIPIGTTSGGSAGGSASSQFSTSYKYEPKTWDELKLVLMGIAGQDNVTVMPSARTVMVKGGRRQIEDVDRLLEDLQRVYARQVVLKVDVISVNVDEQSDFGIDWNLVLKKMNSLGNTQQFFFSSPVGSSEINASSAGIKLIKQVSGQNDFSGSEALFKALHTMHRARLERNYTPIARNLRVTPVATTRNTNYISQTTPAPATTGGVIGGLPGLTQSTISTGFRMTVVPYITGRNTFSMDIGVNLTDLLALVSKSSGTGANQQTIELPDTSGQEFMQSVSNLATGDTLIINSLDQVTDQYDKRTLDRDVSVGAGGNFTGKKSRQSVIILITPMSVEL